MKAKGVKKKIKKKKGKRKKEKGKKEKKKTRACIKITRFYVLPMPILSHPLFLLPLTS